MPSVCHTALMNTTVGRNHNTAWDVRYLYHSQPVLVSAVFTILKQMLRQLWVRTRRFPATLDGADFTNWFWIGLKCVISKICTNSRHFKDYGKPLGFSRHWKWRLQIQGFQWGPSKSHRKLSIQVSRSQQESRDNVDLMERPSLVKEENESFCHTGERAKASILR